MKLPEVPEPDLVPSSGEEAVPGGGEADVIDLSLPRGHGQGPGPCLRVVHHHGPISGQSGAAEGLDTRARTHPQIPDLDEGRADSEGQSGLLTVLDAHHIVGMTLETLNLLLPTQVPNLIDI